VRFGIVKQHELDVHSSDEGADVGRLVTVNMLQIPSYIDQLSVFEALDCTN